MHPDVDVEKLRVWMPEPYRGRRLPATGERTYTLPIEPRSPTVVSDPALLIDPSTAAQHLFDEWGMSQAVLLPLTLGWRADGRHGALIAAAVNDWLAATWLDPAVKEYVRFRGSIRVFPGDTRQAVAEIERWAGDPRFVQVAIPTHSASPYGDERYWPIWQAAAEHNLPIVFHADGGGGIEFPPSMVGFPSHFIEYNTMLPAGGIIHVMSLICQGVFERLPSLVVILADGGFDLLVPLMWRLNKEWRQTRFEVPWVERLPSEYLPAHVRILTSALDGLDEPSLMSRLLEVTDARELLMYGSGYPNWDLLEPSKALAGQPEDLRRRVMYENARALYRPQRGGAAPRGSLL